jgi:hypothetical protein
MKEKEWTGIIVIILATAIFDAWLWVTVLVIRHAWYF